MRLFWSVSASIYKKCSKDIATCGSSLLPSRVVICTKDPTLKSNFLNPFLTTSDSTSTPSFREILSVLESNSRHGASATTDGFSSFSYSFSIPSELLSSSSHFVSSVEELPTYHLDGESLLIFDEKPKPSLHPSDSSSRLLASVARTIRSSRRRMSMIDPVSSQAKNDFLPLVVVLWSKEPLTDAEVKAAVSKPLRRMSSQRSARYFNSLMSHTMSSSHLSNMVKQEESEAALNEVIALMPEQESRQEEERTPQFVSIVVIHFLKNQTPTMIRRMNICPDGVYIPRVGVLFLGDVFSIFV